MEIIAQHHTLFLVMAVAFGLFMTWGMGANDVANSMGTTVGCGAITVRQAVVLAAVMEFMGAYFAGGAVADTLSTGILDRTHFVPVPHLLMFGMIGALLATGIWLMIATLRGWPVSTTHTIVGALGGVGVAALGLDGVRWEMMGGIVVSWFVSPVLGGIVSLLLMLSIRRLIFNTRDPLKQARTWGPLYAFLVGWMVSLVAITRGLGHVNIVVGSVKGHLLALAIGGLAAFWARLMMNRPRIDEHASDRAAIYAGVERLFIPQMLLTGAAMAFAHGSNDVANGIGPMAAALQIIETRVVATTSPITPAILMIGGLGIVVGVITYGYKVIATLGHRITELTPTRAYCATIGAALVTVAASGFGLPVSTSHIVVGAVMGVGIARGIGALDLRVLTGIVVSWFVTVPVGAILAALIYHLLQASFS